MCLCTDLSSEGMYPSLFLSALSSQPDRTLSLCWEQHCKLLPGVQGIQAKQVAAWSVDEVRESHATHTHTLTHTHFLCGAAFPSLPLLVLQVFRFVQNLIGCEEQARIFKDEVRKIIFLVKIHILIGDIYFKTFVLCWIVDMRILPNKDQDSFDLSSPLIKKIK